MHLSFAPIWFNSNELISNLWFFSEVCLLSRGGDDDSRFATFPTAPEKLISRGWTGDTPWLSLTPLSQNQTHSGSFLTLLSSLAFALPLQLKLTTVNSSLLPSTKVRNSCDPVCMMTHLNVILLLYESVWCFTNQLVILITILSLLNTVIWHHFL